MFNIRGIFKFFKTSEKTIDPGNENSLQSYSQEGEDLILKRIFDGKSSGFFVDVGAHHPIRFSNTYLFYKLGWRGVNIDAMPKSMIPFCAQRPGDINLEYPISEDEEILDFFIFNEPALNTFSKSFAEEKNGFKNFKILNKIKLRTSRLDFLLEKFLPPQTKIDFLNIDVEGFDLKVLKSNNWNKYRPSIILVESQSKFIDDIMESEVYFYLKEREYNFFAKTFNTLFFIAKEEKKLIERKKETST